MEIKGVVDQIGSLVWITDRVVVEGKLSTTLKYRNVQLNFVCEVERSAVRVDPREHSVGVWADKGEVEKLDMSTGMRRVVEEAFEWKEGAEKAGSKL